MQRIRKVFGACLGTLAVLVAAPAAQAAVHTSGGAIAIPSFGKADPYPSQIGVAGETGVVGGLRVTLNPLRHDIADEVMVVLEGPLGQKVLLMADSGGGLGVDHVLTFDDAAATTLPDTGPLDTGSFRPSKGTADVPFPAPSNLPAPGPAGPYGLSLLGAFAGTDPNGVWELHVIDDRGGDDGEIPSWSLDIRTTVPPGTPDLVAASDSGFSDADDVTNDTTPDFTGAAGGALTGELQVRADPGTPGNAADDVLLDTPAIAGGVFSTSTAPVLPDGTYGVYARNSVTNQRSASRTVVIDTVAPTTSAPDLDPASDTGASSTDDITADQTPTYLGTASEPARTQVLFNGGVVGAEPSASTAPYAVTADSSVGYGVFSVTGVSTDLAGNVGPASGARTVEITLAGCDLAVTRVFDDARNVVENDSKQRDRWQLLGGDDDANSGHGADCLEGGDGNDVLVAEDGADTLFGDTGADELSGGDGPDRLIGSDGPDVLLPGEGVDALISGGLGDDRIYSRDGRAETVHCDGGFDRVYADPQDTLVGCEGRIGDVEG